MSKQQTSRLAALDFLRFVAAFLVLMYHFTARNDFWPGTPGVQRFGLLARCTNYGYLGVQLFFIISGFVILMTAWGRDVPGFVASRFSRLFPAYWPAVLLTAGIVLLRPFEVPGHKLTLGDLLANLTMMQQAQRVANIDGVYWTLWPELRFYVIMAIFMTIGINRTRVLMFSFLWPLAGMLCQAGGFNAGVLLLVGDWSPLFAAGMVLYLIYREGWSLTAGFVMLSNLVLGVIMVERSSKAIINLTGRGNNPNIAVAFVLVSFALVAVATLTPVSRLRSTFLSWCGIMTYPLYLTHSEVGRTIIHLWGDDLNQWLVVGLATAASIAVALLLHYLFEKPFARPLRRRVESELRGLMARDQESPLPTRAAR